MRYVCLVYFDPHKVFGKSVDPEKRRRDSDAYNVELKALGHRVAAEAHQPPSA
jgi:hypothetical protein